MIKNMMDTSAITDRLKSVRIDFEGGNCPVQIEGYVAGEPFYFRARGRHWSVGVGGEPVLEPRWFHGEEYCNEEHQAGWMPLEEARGLLFEALSLFLSGQPCNKAAYQRARDIEQALSFEASFEELEENPRFADMIARMRSLLAEHRSEKPKAARHFV